jgi:preprotein translocase subunit SecB
VNLPMSVKSKLRKQTKSHHLKSFDQQVELMAMGVESCSCRLDRHTYARLRRSEGDNAVRSVTVEVGLKRSSDLAFDGRISYCLKVTDKRDEGVPLEVSCTFEAHFHSRRRFRSEEAEKFVRDYLRIISWPYLRQFVSDVTSRMAIPPLTLPLLPEDVGTRSKSEKASQLAAQVRRSEI